MSNRFIRSAGGLWILAGITFFLGWWLMPDAGTHDAVQILQQIADHRDQVWLSIIAHLISSLALMIGIIGIQTDRRMSFSKTVKTGAVLTALGAMGICMNAFFHLAVFYMTAPGIDPANMAEPMRLFQSQGILFVMPLLLALIIGGTVYTAGFYHVDATSPWAKRVFLIGLAWALLGAGAARLGMISRPSVTLGFLGLISLGFIWAGCELLFKLRPDRLEQIDRFQPRLRALSKS